MDREKMLRFELLATVEFSSIFSQALIYISTAALA